MASVQAGQSCLSVSFTDTHACKKKYKYAKHIMWWIESSPTLFSILFYKWRRNREWVSACACMCACVCECVRERERERERRKEEWLQERAFFQFTKAFKFFPMYSDLFPSHLHLQKKKEVLVAEGSTENWFCPSTAKGFSNSHSLSLSLSLSPSLTHSHSHLHIYVFAVLLKELSIYSFFPLYFFRMKEVLRILLLDTRKKNSSSQKFASTKFSFSFDLHSQLRNKKW